MTRRRSFDMTLAGLYGMTFILAGCSIIYELLIAQILSWFMFNSVVWYSLVIGVYIGSLGIGAALFYRYGRDQDPRLVLCRTEIFLSILGGLSILLILLDNTLFHYFAGEGPGVFPGPLASYGLSLLLCFLITAGIGLLTGKEIPALIAIAQSVLRKDHATSRIIAADCFGSCAGGVMFATILVPYFSLLSIATFVALANLFCLFLLLFWFCRPLAYFRISVSVGLCLMMGLIFLGVQNERVEQYFLQKIYYQGPAPSLVSFLQPSKDLPPVTRFRSAYQTIDLVPRVPARLDPVLRILCKAYSQKTAQGKFYEKGFLLAIDGAGQFHSDIEEFYHEYFAHIPIILQKKIPETILVLGGGDGMLIRELLKYPSVKEIDHVDIDPVIVSLSRTRRDLLFLNQGSLQDPRVRTLIRDGYHYIRTCAKSYDAIYLDFPIAYDYNVNKLYSFEFYSFAKKHLNPGGYLVFDIGPFAARSGSAGRQEKIRHRKQIHIDTVRAAGFQSVIPYNVNLELDNARARQDLGRYYMDFIHQRGRPQDPSEDLLKRRDAWIENVLTAFCEGQRDGYIFAVREKRSFDFQYVGLGIPLYALNQERFATAFPFRGVASEPVDLSKVNSIMKPILLNMR